MPEFDRAVAPFGHGARLGVGRLLLCVQEGENPPGGGAGRAEAAGHPGDAGEGLGKLLSVLQHGLHVAYEHPAAQHGEAAEHGAERVAEVVDEVSYGPDLAGGGLGLLGGHAQGGVYLLELFAGAAGVVEDAHELLAVVELLNAAVEPAYELLLLGVALRAGAHHAHAREQAQRHHGYGNQGERGAEREHHDEDAYRGHGLGDYGGEVLAEGAVHRVHVVRYGAEYLAVGVRIVIAQLQRVHLGVYVRAQGLHDARGELRHAEVLQQREELRDEVERDEGYEQEDYGLPVEFPARDARVELGGYPARDGGREHGEHRREHGGEHDEHEPQLMAAQVFKEALKGL